MDRVETFAEERTQLIWASDLARVRRRREQMNRFDELLIEFEDFFLRLDRPANRYTLVLAVHPHCPCTRASLDELAVIMTRGSGRVAARVLFVQPEGFSERWAQTDMWRTVRSIPAGAS